LGRDSSLWISAVLYIISIGREGKGSRKRLMDG
jgi:hypothetical protein